MAFTKICRVADLPALGEMRAVAVEDRVLCIGNAGGQYAAVDNVCPHRGGPLAEGTIEAGKVLCPWHAWAFDLKTGLADHDASARVTVYPLQIEGESVLADL